MLTVNDGKLQQWHCPSVTTVMSALVMLMAIAPVVNEKLNGKMHWLELDCNASLTSATVSQLKNCATG
jgi:hypothetical protein